MLFSICINANDQSLGPMVLGCRDDFDFTVKFEQLFFSLVPSVVFIFLSLWRICLLIHRPTIVDAPMLRLIKLGVTSSYTLLELSSVILINVLSLGADSVDIASSVLRLLSSVFMIWLSYFDHEKSPRPSILLDTYLFWTLLFDITQVRTFWLASQTGSELVFSAIFTAMLVTKIAMILLEAQRKTKWVTWNAKEHSPEETSSIFHLGVYSWLNWLFLEGYRKVLSIKDLYPLDQNMAADRLSKAFTQQINDARLKGHKPSIIKVLARTLLVPLILPIPARLARIGFTFCQPLFISSLTTRLSQPESTLPANIKYGFIGASICIYFSIAISTALYWYAHHRMLYMARACLVTAVYAKATEAREDENASLTLMSTDVERTMSGFKSFHEIWSNFIEVGFSSALLYRSLGAAFAAPIIIVLICASGVGVITRFTGKGQRTWVAGVQKRVGLTSGVIATMKNIKLSGLTHPIARVVEKLRVDELKAGQNFRTLLLIAGVFAYIPLLVSPAVTFAVARRSLDPSRLFTSVSYLLLMTSPLSNLFQTLPQFVGALACLSRIQEFLEIKSRDDFRITFMESEDSTEKPSVDESSALLAVTIKNGSFGWEPDKMVLNNIDIEIPKSCLTMIVGPVASGKSSLCKALLGEMPYHRGTVTITSNLERVGYCDQTPFLSNSSIRENIIGYSPFDPERYAEVVDVTMLGVDFETLSLKDMTNVGSNGITLSGGQKQRVSLARCLYLQSDLLIMDDVFSGLDTDTEDLVFQRVFGANGILKRRQTTVVLCTHSVRHLPSAAHVIALAPDGSVTEQGTFDDLMVNRNYIHSLGVKSSSISQIASDKLESEPDAPEPPDNSLGKIPPLPPAPKINDKARLTGDKAAYMVYLKSMGMVLGTCLLVLGMLFGFFCNFPTVWLKYWSDDATAANPVHSFSYYAGIYALLQTSALMSLLFLAILIYITVINRSGKSLHDDALRTLTHAPLSFLTTTDQGTITNLFSQDLNLIDNDLPHALLNVINAVLVAIGQAAVIATSSPFLAISYPFLIAVLYGIQKFYLRTSRQLRLLDLEAKSPLYTHFIDTSNGVVTLRAFGFIANDRKKNGYLLDTSQRPAYLLTMIQQWLGLVLNFVVAIIAVMLTSLAISLRSNSGFTGASLVALMGFGETLTNVVTYYTLLETSLGAITRLKSFEKDSGLEDKKDEDIIPPEEWPQHGEISLKGVSASYRAENATEVPSMALKNIKLEVSSGEKVAVCGRTGSGKSSLVALLMKLLDPVDDTPDRVFIDNTPLHRVDRTTLRQRIIAIPQDIVFLPDGSTFQENLDPSTVSTAAESRAVIEAVGLWTFVRDRGGLKAGLTASTLSQGQRQLFSLARAILRRRVRARSLGLGGGGTEGGVLLLDEVSSSVDRETEKVMQKVISVEFKEYTVIAISHHLDMVMDYDRVVVMDKGEIVEVGNPTQLVKQAGTRFGELWNVGGK
ncbi:putative ABC multidrug transporter [Daldinia decipiens]|uniref:putative ABC multidrug transporter n=1 Tax=Daldinia decipiens TaxID=326647 RepID=UPI0020C50C0E|nr:putative ABC multidrug transporter [Daldinia decipiens]KAI1662286.1 putative ABC multidrug transporter [Daldinia decipiens]